jgi:DNA repair exonuclease SbcCD nuclease subunit
MAEPGEIQVAPETKEVNPEISALKNESAQKRIRIKELEEKLTLFESEQIKKQDELLKEQNKYKELYEKSVPEIEAKKQIEAKYNELLEKETKREQAHREKLLSRLPEDTRELFANMELDKLEIYVDKQVDIPLGDRGKNFSKTETKKPKTFKEWKALNEN